MNKARLKRRIFSAVERIIDEEIEAAAPGNQAATEQQDVSDLKSDAAIEQDYSSFKTELADLWRNK